MKLSKRQIKQIAYAWASGLLYTTDGTSFMDVEQKISEEDQSAIVNEVKAIAVRLIRKAGNIDAISLPRIIEQTLKTNTDGTK